MYILVTKPPHRNCRRWHLMAGRLSDSSGRFPYPDPGESNEVPTVRLRTSCDEPKPPPRNPVLRWVRAISDVLVLSAAAAAAAAVWLLAKLKGPHSPFSILHASRTLASPALLLVTAAALDDNNSNTALHIYQKKRGPAASNRRIAISGGPSTDDSTSDKQLPGTTHASCSGVFGGGLESKHRSPTGPKRYSPESEAPAPPSDGPVFEKAAAGQDGGQAAARRCPVDHELQLGQGHAQVAHEPAPLAHRQPVVRRQHHAADASNPFSPSMAPRADLPKPPDPNLDPAAYLRSLNSVRERSRIITDKATRNKLNHFDVDMNKFPDVVRFVCGIIKRDYDAPFHTIPMHSRYQHFCVGGRDRIANLLSTFDDSVDQTEKCRRLIDLFMISVLLDAGAGTHWTFKSAENGRIYRRSEGLAIASLEMFKTGMFSGDARNKFQVDKEGLSQLTVEQLAKGLQIRPGNEIAGLDGRAELLIRLGTALQKQRIFFGDEGRPGNMVGELPLVAPHDTGLLHAHRDTARALERAHDRPGLHLADDADRHRRRLSRRRVAVLLDAADVRRPLVAHVAILLALPRRQPAWRPSTGRGEWESIVPLHKLTQWLCYSLMQPMTSLLKVQFAGSELLTGLPEYRNGGLFVDMGVLNLRKEDEDRGLEHYANYCRRLNVRANEVAPMFEPSDDVIVEWRGVTVGLMDKLCDDVNYALREDLNGGEITLGQLMEAGSWKGGREIAEVSRPNTKEPPILIDSDGTLF
ncbi:urg3 [Apiospora hydei]|uniref:Urg3 n=1 Tax=Apiospora hydei TaxID=1337664 RepID=A0ABR1VAJ6_9PEZI